MCLFLRRRIGRPCLGGLRLLRESRTCVNAIALPKIRAEKSLFMNLFPTRNSPYAELLTPKAPSGKHGEAPAAEIFAGTACLPLGESVPSTFAKNWLAASKALT